MNFKELLEEIRRDCQEFERQIESGSYIQTEEEQDEITDGMVQYLVQYSDVFDDLVGFEAELIECVFNKEEPEIRSDSFERFMRKAEDKFGNRINFEYLNDVANEFSENGVDLITNVFKNRMLQNPASHFIRREGHPSNLFSLGNVVSFRKSEETNEEDDKKAQTAIEEVLAELGEFE